MFFFYSDSFVKLHLYIYQSFTTTIFCSSFNNIYYTKEKQNYFHISSWIQNSSTWIEDNFCSCSYIFQNTRIIIKKIHSWLNVHKIIYGPCSFRCPLFAEWFPPHVLHHHNKHIYESKLLGINTHNAWTTLYESQWPKKSRFDAWTNTKWL